MPSINVRESLIREYDAIEAIKVLRTNLFFSGSDVKSILITSCHQGEGKTTVALNLAASIAQSGKKVLVLDTDLRKSVLYQKFEKKHNSDKSMVGLCHFLSGMAGPKDILYKTDIPGMFMIFAGAAVRNSDELLGNSQFSQLLKKLRTLFDYVIIDTPPLGQVIDCAIIAPLVDRAVLVVDVNDNSYKMARRVKKQLEGAECKIFGVVLNRINLREKGKRYGYYQKYGKYEIMESSDNKKTTNSKKSEKKELKQHEHNSSSQERNSDVSRK